MKEEKRKKQGDVDLCGAFLCFVLQTSVILEDVKFIKEMTIVAFGIKVDVFIFIRILNR